MVSGVVCHIIDVKLTVGGFSSVEALAAVMMGVEIAVGRGIRDAFLVGVFI